MCIRDRNLPRRFSRVGGQGERVVPGQICKQLWGVWFDEGRHQFEDRRLISRQDSIDQISGGYTLACVRTKLIWLEVVRVQSRISRTSLRKTCLLYTSDAADDLLCVDLGGRRIIKK